MKIRLNAIRVLIGLLLIHAMLLGWGAAIHSPTIDEIEWLPGGWASWQTGRFGIVTRNPPHVGLLAAVPLLLTEHDASAVNVQGGARAIGRAFIQTNGYRSFWLFTLGRWTCIPFSVLGAIACFAWARELYGDRSGILAATLWCFCPNILAHGQLVAHDVPATSLGVLACYAFWRWLRQPNVTNALLAGAGLGFALLTKMTVLLYFILWPALWACWCVSFSDRRRSYRVWLAEGALLATSVIVALDILNLGYGLHGTLSPLGSFTFHSSLLKSLAEPTDRFPFSLIGQLPVPLPAAFVSGLDTQRYFLEGGLGSEATYLRGEWYTHGVPYYYLYALMIKLPLGTWCLLALAVIFRARRIDGGSFGRDEFVLLAPAVAVLAIASESPGFTDHLRYILPSFPFVFIWISRLARIERSHNRWLGSISLMALSWTIVSSLWIYPHNLSYFNELVGGPRMGHQHLLSSNIDYGQDLIMLKRWCESHPEARPLGLAYWDFESVDPRITGLDCFVAPSGPRPGEPMEASAASQLGPQPGWYAVNVNTLHGDEWPGRNESPGWGYYGYFLELAPVAMAGYSIAIYHVGWDEANLVRARMGLPPIAPKRH